MVDSRGQIFKIRLSDQTYSVFATGLPLNSQACVYDGNGNRLLVAVYASETPIFAVDLDDSTVSTVVASTPGGFLDGIAMDHERNTYIASHADGGGIWMYDSALSPFPKEILHGLDQPAGLKFNVKDKILAIPLFAADSLAFLPWGNYHDTDHDNVPDAEDDCPEIFNREQTNSDGDGFGDACDRCAGFNDNDDVDSDGIPDSCDICPEFPDPDQFDSDLDGIGDSCDNCPSVHNPDQADLNGDGIGDICEGCCLPPTVGDIDQSGVIDISDISVLIDNQFLTLTPFTCDAEGDLDLSGVIDITDIQILIDNQILTLSPLLPCP